VQSLSAAAIANVDTCGFRNKENKQRAIAIETMATKNGVSSSSSASIGDENNNRNYFASYADEAHSPKKVEFTLAESNAQIHINTRPSRAQLNINDVKNYSAGTVSNGSDSYAEKFAYVATLPTQQANGAVFIAANGQQQFQQQQQQQSQTIITTIANNGQKIARDCLIHKNDVFQFDDVESVRTSDIYFKSTPPSSLDSEGTNRSLSIQQPPPPPSASKSMLASSTKNVSSSTNATPKHKKEKISKKISNTLIGSTKLKKSNTSNLVINQTTSKLSSLSLERTPPPQQPSSSSAADSGLGVSSHAASSTSEFTRRFSNLKRLLHPKSQTNSSSGNIKAADSKQFIFSDNMKVDSLNGKPKSLTSINSTPNVNTIGKAHINDINNRNSNTNSNNSKSNEFSSFGEVDYTKQLNVIIDSNNNSNANHINGTLNQAMTNINNNKSSKSNENEKESDLLPVNVGFMTEKKPRKLFNFKLSKTRLSHK
jgi:hypothetical protein